MPKGTILDLNVACIAMALCLDSGGERVRHDSVTYARNDDLNAVNSRTVWQISGPMRYVLDSEQIFSEIARELAREVWGVVL